jgi:hypothetical protein
MTLLHEAAEQKKFDVRLIERHLSSGAIQFEQAEKVSLELQDDEAAAVWVSVEELQTQSFIEEDEGPDSYAISSDLDEDGGED